MTTRHNYSILAFAVVGIVSASSYAQVLFTTQDDFTGWQDNSSNTHFLGTPVATPDSDGSTVNGLGNTVNPGAAGTAGSEQLVWETAAGSYSFFFSPGEQANTAFLSALDPGSGGGNLVSYSGTITLDSTLPTGSLGIVLNYSSNFGQFFGTTTAPNANGFSTTVIPYTVNAVSGLSYFQFGIIFNSGYTGTFDVDNIQLLSAPTTTFADVSANWVTNGSGTWETATHWSSNPQIPGGSPDTIGAQITFDNNGGAITANPTVTLSQPATAADLAFGNTNGGPTPNYTINSGSLGATITVSSEIDSYSGNHVVNVPVSTGSSNFFFDVLAGSNLTIANFSDGSTSNLTKVDTGTLNIGAPNLHLTLTLDGTMNFIDGKSGGFLFGVNVNSDGVLNLGKNSWNTNTITSDSQALGVINIPTGGTLYTAEYLGGAPATMFYNGLFTGGGSIVIGEGATSTDTSQVIYGNSAVFYGSNTGFNGTVTVGSSFPVGGPMTAPAVFTLEVGSASNLGDGSASNQVILDGGILQAIGSFTGTQNVMITAKGGTIDTDGPAGGSGAIIPGGTAISLGSVSSTANGVLTKINSGQLTVAKMTGISLVVNSGIVRLAPNGTTAGASSLNALTFAVDGNNVPQGSLDITNNIVSIAASSSNDPITTIVGYLKTGYDNGNWDGAGIQSSSVLTQRGTGIGYADGNTDTGTAAPAGIIVVRDTWLGDLNVDGSITSADLSMLTANIGHSGAGVDWAHGDLNYDGTVNADDVSLFMLGAAQFKAGGSIAVPEPTTIGLLAMGAAAMVRRRRR